MKNYWHITALCAATSIITILTGNYFVVALLFVWLLYLFYFKSIPRLVIVLSILSFFFFYYYSPTIKPLSRPAQNQANKQTEHYGEIVGPSKITADRVEFYVRLSNTHEKINLVHFFDEPSDDVKQTATLKSGAKCTFNGALVIPNSATNPYQFDYQDYLWKQGIKYQVVLSSLAEINCTNADMMNYLYQIHHKLSSFIRTKLDGQTSAWMMALLLGDDSYLDEAIVSVFQNWGLSHILAISGLHIGIVVGLIYFLLIRTGVTTKETAQWIMIGFLPVYAVIAGSQPSVWRASIMVMFVIVLNKIKLKYNYTDIVSIIFILLMIVNKYIIFHIGFQLSFAVTFGLIISSKWLSQSRTNLEGLLQISFVSQMMILPLQLHYFSLFQPLSILVNVIVVPYFSLFVIPFMFMLLLSIWLPDVLVHFAEMIFLIIHQIFIQGLNWLDTHFNYPFIIGEFPIYFSILYYLLFIVMMMYLESRKLKQGFAYATLLLLFIVTLAVRPHFSPIGTVTMLDIGQGDVFIIELPYRKGVFMIDVGAALSFPNFEATNKQYDQIIKPFLYGRGISKIDAVFISHEHLDHYGSLSYLLEDIVVDEIIISEHFKQDNVLAEEWQEGGIHPSRVAFNEMIIRKNQAFQVLSPVKDKQSANENSLVLYTEIGGLTWLFTGDMYKAEEMAIINHFRTLKVDVLKVGHHGSDTSTAKAFLEHIDPTVALIPVGINNIYNHPREEVIERLREEGMTIYRSDEDGAVQFFYREDRGYFQPFLSK